MYHGKDTRYTSGQRCYVQYMALQIWSRVVWWQHGQCTCKDWCSRCINMSGQMDHSDWYCKVHSVTWAIPTYNESSANIYLLSLLCCMDIWLFIMFSSTLNTIIIPALMKYNKLTLPTLLPYRHITPTINISTWPVGPIFEANCCAAQWRQLSIPLKVYWVVHPGREASYSGLNSKLK